MLQRRKGKRSQVNRLQGMLAGVKGGQKKGSACRKSRMGFRQEPVGGQGKKGRTGMTNYTLKGGEPTDQGKEREM